MTSKKTAKKARENKSSKLSAKKASNSSLDKPASRTDDPVEKIMKEALPMLRTMHQPTHGSLLQAREIIRKLVVDGNEPKASIGEKLLFLISCNLSTKHLPGYATLDTSHTDQINMLIQNVQRYVSDASQKRPLNFLMLAAPGAGKSHFIKCIANKLQSQNVEAITFNMAGLQRYEDLIPPLDTARNVKVADSIPLLFLDEFDSAPENVAFLLPLLWDGELNLGQRDLKLGKVIIVLAGSDPSLPNMMDQARSMRSEASIVDGRNPKVVDLLSRINGGVILIPPFYDRSHGIDRRFDKVCIVTQLLRQRFGSTLKQVSLALLRFLSRTEFRYGVRSLAHLVELIPHKKDAEELKISDLKLPIDDPVSLKSSSLAYHLLHDDQAHGIVKVWEEVSTTEELLPVFNRRLLSMPVADDLPDTYRKFYFRRVIREFESLAS